MAARIWFLAAYFLFWLLYFLFMKAVFLIYHQPLTHALSPAQIGGIFWHGLPLDLSFSAYLCLLPFGLVALSAQRGYRRWLSLSLSLYTNLLLILLTVLCTSDLELFSIWGFRMDASPLIYLNTPKEMVVSVGSSPLLLIILLNIVINIFFSSLYRLQLGSQLQQFGQGRHGQQLPLLLLTALLILPMRGGLQKRPLDQRTAFFSDTHFANQAALNLPWNFFHALYREKDKDQHPYLYLDPVRADSLVQGLYMPGLLTRPQQLLRQPRPNIILIIWESLTAKVVEPLGGQAGVTPRFSALSQEGLLFSRMYASGDRSDKGLVAILSGYPAQPNTTISRYPEKLRRLPQLSHRLKGEGYSTAFYYGGNLAFANLRTYLSFGQWERVISQRSFTSEELAAKWGAHDGVVLERLSRDLKGAQSPFFATLFTLSSHEPFELPASVAPRFPGKSGEAKFLSAHHYTDSVVGRFVDEARRQPWWDNTLLIIVADHGHTDPGLSQVYEPEKFHIPMLWLGGALAEGGKVWPQVLSQTDLIATLLGQLGLPATEFSWSRDAFSPNTRAFAPYFFKDGVGLVTDSSWFSWDNIGRKPIEQQASANPQEEEMAKAYLQKSFADYLSK
jgi:phosphoglycerol transferase MdoB-like AlkP superfamily enzyme